MTELNPQILAQFALDGELQEFSTLKRGHINETFVSRWKLGSVEKRFVHQHINSSIFRDVPLVMRNIAAVTRHIRAKIAAGEGVPGETTLTVIPSRSGEPYVLSPAKDYWRTYEFLEGTHCIDFCTDPDQAYRGAEAFGRFFRYLSDLPAGVLQETIPRFQDSVWRFGQLDGASRTGRPERIKEASSELNFAASKRKLADDVATALRSGDIPLRNTHADPKVNNVLFSNESGAGICIVDLDTCMPGTVLFDFGDLARNTCLPTNEDEQDFSKVYVDRELFEAVARGFLKECSRTLVPSEIRLLSIAPRLLALTLGVRFLTDYLNGDVYFKVHRPKHNLERARTQFQVVREMEDSEELMGSIIGRCLA